MQLRCFGWVVVGTLVLLMGTRSFGASAEVKGKGEVSDFALIDHQGAFRHLYYYAKDPKTRAIVLFVQGNGCPLVRKQVPQLKRLRDTYGTNGIMFWMINANRQDRREDVAREAAEFEIDFPILLDEAQLVAKGLKVTRTAEAIVIDPKDWSIRYRGAIDDRLSYEAQKPAAKHEYLKDALDALLSERPIKTEVTSAPGCVVTQKKMETASYTETIAPMLKENCVRCHARGGIGPFAMSSYERVHGWSDMIREVLLTRRMPPWQADLHVGKFGNDFSLSSEQTATLVQWIDAGAPRGKGVDPLEGYQPELPEWKLGKPDFIVEIPEQSVAAEGVFDYRYIFVDTPNTEDVWLRGTEILPGNTRVLHHIIATTIMPGEDRTRNGKSLTGYAPGMGPDLLPKGTGRLLRAGSKIVFQLHYTASGKAEKDRSRLGLYLSKEPPAQELRSSVLIDGRFKIPPGDPEFVTSKSRRVDRDALLYTMNPHMHLRGKWMRYIARYPDGTKEMLLNVPNYRFDWQRNYELAEPKRLPKGTEIIVEAAWDNSPLNLNNPDPTKEVGWGDQTFNEMFFASFRYTYPDAALPEARTSQNATAGP
ncbi:MAG TPA: redoxin domain-containing protein [Verrucomicrobiae bacterium]|nr:redoxin domain-containing protein [Verrucomicrobiae bacterium]